MVDLVIDKILSMKGLIAALIFQFFVFSMGSQENQERVFKQMFDRSRTAVKTYHMRHTGNYGIHYGDGISYYLESLLIMYEETHEINYLEEFKELVHTVIRNRDDHAGKGNGPYWSSVYRPKRCEGPITYHTGLILQSMTHFIYLSKKVYTDAFQNDFQFAFRTFDNQTVTNFNELADWLYTHVQTTHNYYEKYHWIENRGYKQYAGNDPCKDETGTKGEQFFVSHDVDGLDRNCNWGVVNVYLSLAFEGDSAGALYYDHALVAARELEKCMRSYTLSNGMEYTKWGWRGWTLENRKNKGADYFYKDDAPDDISHAGAVIDLVYLLNKHKDKFRSSETGCCPRGYFTDEEVIKISNTFIYNIYYGPQAYHNALDGSAYLSSPESKCPGCDNVLQFGLSRWLKIADFVNADYHPASVSPLYHMISDFFSKMNEFPGLVFSGSGYNTGLENYSRGGSPGATILGLALAHKHQSFFKFMGRNSSPAAGNGNDWQGVSSGDFDRDGISNEIVGIRNSDGGIWFFKVLENDKTATRDTLTIDFKGVGYRVESYGPVSAGGLATGVSNSYWKGITAGRFVQDLQGDQVAGIRESDGAVFVWEPVFDPFTQRYSLRELLFQAPGPEQQWTGISSGNFDQDPQEEIAAIRNADGGIFLWKVNGTAGNYSLKNVLSDHTPGDKSEWAAVSSGDLDNDGINELAAVRNADGGIFVWKIRETDSNLVLTPLVFDNSRGAWNNWNGITIGDFDGDGVKELVLHRDCDGGFFIFHVVGKLLELKGVDYFPYDHGIRVFNTCKSSGSSHDLLVNLRNGDGDITVFAIDPGFKKTVFDKWNPK